MLSAARTIPTIWASLGAPPPCACALSGCSATANMIAAIAKKALERLCLLVFELLAPIDLCIFIFVGMLTHLLVCWLKTGSGLDLTSLHDLGQPPRPCLVLGQAHAREHHIDTVN